MTLELKDKIAIVTGATKGIGLATAVKLLEEGAVVIICSRRKDAVENTVSELSSLGIIEGYAVDVSQKKQVDKMIATTYQKYGRVDILVNNAGVVNDVQFYKMTDEQFKEVIDINLMGTYFCIKSVVNIMKDQGYGKIINLSSISAINGSFGQSNYATAKAGVIGMTRVLGKELGKFNINVNAVLPGSVESDISSKLSPEVQEMRVKQTALKRMGKPEDVANLISFLASEASRHITAQTIVIDGGRI